MSQGGQKQTYQQKNYFPTQTFKKVRTSYRYQPGATIKKAPKCPALSKYETKEYRKSPYFLTSEAIDILLTKLRQQKQLCLDIPENGHNKRSSHIQSFSCKTNDILCPM